MNKKSFFGGVLTGVVLIFIVRYWVSQSELRRQ